jgi:hypothetical protein
VSTLTRSHACIASSMTSRASVAAVIGPPGNFINGGGPHATMNGSIAATQHCSNPILQSAILQFGAVTS